MYKMRPEFSNVYILKTYNAVSGVLCILQADISAMRIITLAHSLYRYFFNEKKKRRQNVKCVKGASKNVKCTIENVNRREYRAGCKYIESLLKVMFSLLRLYFFFACINGCDERDGGHLETSV